jgi:putative peptidoglycan lipid II flippase
LKILSLYLFFAFLNAYFSALLVYKGVFFKSYFSQAIFNLTVIAFVLLFHKEWGILSLVWGAVFGGTLQVFYILLVSKGEGVFTLPSFEFNEKLKGFFKNLLPSFGSVGIGQLTTLAEAFLAAAAGSGVLSSLYYAFRLYQLPFGLVGVAVSRVALTDMAASTSERALVGKLVKASEIALFFAVPAALYLSLGAEPIVKTVYARGAFGETDAGRTALYLSLYALGLPFAVLHSVLGNLFFVRKSFYTFFFLSLPWFLTEIVGGFLGVFVFKLGGGALAFSYALGAFISFLSACLFLRVCHPMVGTLRGMGKFLPLWGFSAFVLIFSRDLKPLPFLVETFAGAAVYLWLFYRLYIKGG